MTDSDATPFAKGLAAARAGKRATANPYRGGGEENQWRRVRWMAGFVTGQADAGPGPAAALKATRPADSVADATTRNDALQVSLKALKQGRATR